MRDREKQPCVYILANRRNGTLYTGVTSCIADRIFLHESELLQGFTSRYGIRHLVYYEMHATMEQAITREKRLKRWNRLWKLRLIEDMNPEWQPLFDKAHGLLDPAPSGQVHSSRHWSICRDLSGFPPARE
ncbi:MAG: GIY-YIG nuclease family protein [Pseudomonadota bacterium]